MLFPAVKTGVLVGMQRMPPQTNVFGGGGRARNLPRISYSEKNLFVRVDRIAGICLIRLQPGGLGGAARPRQIVDQGMGGALVDRCRPVLHHRCVRRNGETVVRPTVEDPASLVVHRQQRERTCAPILGTEEGKRVPEARAVKGWGSLERLRPGCRAIREPPAEVGHTTGSVP